jgi:hypothetical protein
VRTNVSGFASTLLYNAVRTRINRRVFNACRRLVFFNSWRFKILAMSAAASDATAALEKICTAAAVPRFVAAHVSYRRRFSCFPPFICRLPAPPSRLSAVHRSDSLALVRHGRTPTIFLAPSTMPLFPPPPLVPPSHTGVARFRCSTKCTHKSPVCPGHLSIAIGCCHVSGSHETR